MQKLQRFWRGLVVLSLICLTAGCVHEKELTNSGFIEPLGITNAGHSVKVVSVSDMRKFEKDQPDDQTPTLADANDIGNKAIMLRAVGKGNNMAHKFYFSYPQGRTVESVVRTAIENALLTKGYSVVSNDSPAAVSAIPINVDIRKFWNWFHTAGFVFDINYEVELDLRSPIVLNGGTETVAADFVTYTPFIADSLVGKNIEEGLGKLIKNMQPKLKNPN